jgi:hypothetical protein
MDNEKTPRKPNRRSIYKESLQYAVQNGEKEWYHKSDKINQECAAAIDRAISDSYKDMYHADVQSALEKVCADFGKNRLTWVVAAVVKGMEFDGRISNRNKDWAQNFPIPMRSENYYGYHLNIHATIVDSIADRIRLEKVQTKKPSVLGEMQENKKGIAEKMQENSSEKAAAKTKKRDEPEV